MSSVLRGMTFSSVVWKRTLSRVRTTVPFRTRTSWVFLFVNRATPLALTGSSRSPVAFCVYFWLRSFATRVSAPGISPCGPARRSNSIGPSAFETGATTTVAVGPTTTMRTSAAASRLPRMPRTRTGDAPTARLTRIGRASAARRAVVSGSVASSSCRSSAAVLANAGRCTDDARARARVSGETIARRRVPAARRATSKNTALRAVGAPAAIDSTRSSAAGAAEMRSTASSTLARAPSSMTVRPATGTVITRISRKRSRPRRPRRGLPRAM